MLEISPAALAQLKLHLDGQKISSPIRIGLLKGTCAGPALRFFMDDVKEGDHVLERDGICFLVDRHLASSCGTITIDFEERFDQCPCSGRVGGFRFRCQNTSCCAEGYCDVCCPDCCQFAGSAGCPAQESCTA